MVVVLKRSGGSNSQWESKFLPKSLAACQAFSPPAAADSSHTQRDDCESIKILYVNKAVTSESVC